MSKIIIDDEKSAVEYIRTVLTEWDAWKTHHVLLVQALEILLKIHQRKASDAAREIFEEIEKITMHGVTPFGLCLMSMGEAAFAKIKKKYTEEGK